MSIEDDVCIGCKLKAGTINCREVKRHWQRYVRKHGTPGLAEVDGFLAEHWDDFTLHLRESFGPQWRAKLEEIARRRELH
jgi:hypothetical protein